MTTGSGGSGRGKSSSVSSWVITAVALAVFTAACSGGDEAEIEELKERIEELEAAATPTTSLTTTSSTSTTVAAAPTTTAAPGTTVTFIITTVATTTTTTTLASVYDWDAVTFDDVIAWRAELPNDVLFAFTSSCASALDGLQATTRAVGDEILPVFDVAAAAEAGETPVSDAVDSFEAFSLALGELRAIAEVLATRRDLGDVFEYAEDVLEASNALIFPIVTIKVLAFDAETNTVDSEAFNAWAVGLDEKVLALVELSFDFSARGYCN